MTQYFKNVTCIEDLKKAYFEYAKKYHPDVNPDGLEIMKKVNAEYDRLYPKFKNIHKKSDGTTYQKAQQTPKDGTKTDAENAKIFRDLIMRLVKLDGVNVEVCGTWIWLSGNTYTHRKTIKGYGFRWSDNKKMWYYRDEENEFRAWKDYKPQSIESIRSAYGSIVYTDNEQKKLEA